MHDYTPTGIPVRVIQKHQRAKTRDAGLTNTVSEAIQKLEEISLGPSSLTVDNIVRCSNASQSVSCFLIRPYNSQTQYQIGFLFGEKHLRWKTVAELALLRYTVNARTPLDYGNGTGIEAKCSCMAYRESSACNHYNAMFEDDNNPMRIFSFLGRVPLCSLSNWQEDVWEYLRVPRENYNDDVRVVHTYRRKEISSLFPTSTSVVLYNRQSRVRKRMAERLSCLLCKGRAGKRMMCSHEIAAKIFLEGEDLSHGNIQIGRVNNADSFWDGVMAGRKQDSMEREDCGIYTGSNGNPCDKVSFASQQKRIAFICPQEEQSLLKILQYFFDNKGMDVNQGSNGPKAWEDSILECQGCHYDARTSKDTVFQRRIVSLHTLHHGAISFWVTDFNCRYCGKLIPYDGLEDGVFCVNGKQVFTREVLDKWVWDICGSGGTFRDAYSSWSSKATAFSACFQIIGATLYVNRLLCNEVFSLFLKSLKFPRNENLFELFSCSTCETRDSDGKRVLKGVVMDGTALGILGTLPNFSRHTKVVMPLKGVPNEQYIIRDAKLRGFAESILVSAKYSGEKDMVLVRLKLSLRRKQDSLFRKLFSLESSDVEENNLARRYLITFLVAKEIQSQTDSLEDNSDEDSDGSGWQISHTLAEIDVRRTLLEFGRCFL